MWVKTIRGAAIAAAVLGLSLTFAALSAAQPPTAAQQIEHDPLTISVSTVGRFAKGYSWHLSVNSAGQAALTVETYPQRTERRFDISKEQLAALRKTLLAERFFDLADEYGELVPDGSADTITVTAGDQVKTIKLHYLMNWVQSDKPRLRDPSRAVRVLLTIREWFDDAQAVDLRRYDRMVVEAAKQ